MNVITYEASFEASAHNYSLLDVTKPFINSSCCENTVKQFVGWKLLVEV